MEALSCLQVIFLDFNLLIVMHDTLPLLNKIGFPAISRGQTETLQINIGLRCNQQCVHCHVNSSPRRTEQMSKETIAAVYDYVRDSSVQSLDITGGAPELHPQFRQLVADVRGLNVKVIDRCNLTILTEPGQVDLAAFLAQHEVEVIASLPCYSQENVDRQRGDGVFVASIDALKQLNSLGYGQAGSGLKLHLVYNPQGPQLPPAQDSLEQEYKAVLMRDYGIVFNELFVLCNMPIKRFGSMLVSKGTFDEYLALLQRSHKHENLPNVMCRSLLSVDWQGFIYDCDFNQMLGLNVEVAGQRLHISDVKKQAMDGRAIVVGDHCYGCTAGQGSSCGGALG